MTTNPVPLSVALATLVLGHDNKTTPRGAGTPMRGASPTEIGHDRLMETVPPHTDSPPESRADGCPGCAQNVEVPNSTTPLTNGFRAAYLCSDCGHAWTTDWKD